MEQGTGLQGDEATVGDSSMKKKRALAANEVRLWRYIFDYYYSCGCFMPILLCTKRVVWLYHIVKLSTFILCALVCDFLLLNILQIYIYIYVISPSKTTVTLLTNNLLLLFRYFLIAISDF